VGTGTKTTSSLLEEAGVKKYCHGRIDYHEFDVTVKLHTGGSTLRPIVYVAQDLEYTKKICGDHVNPRSALWLYGSTDPMDNDSTQVVLCPHGLGVNKLNKNFVVYNDNEIGRRVSISVRLLEDLCTVD